MDSNIPDTSLLFLDKRSYVGITRGRLPHWSQQGRALFVTFRLTDSLPQNRLDQLARMKQEWLDTHPLPWSDDALSEYEHKILVQVNKWLDAGYGSCILQRHDIRQVVTDALRFYDEKQYKLWAYVVMPNHVHLVASPIGDGNVMKPVGNAKRYSATMINRMQGCQGHLWQRESFDRIVRSGDHFERIIRYIKNNPCGLPPDCYSLYVADNIPGGQVPGIPLKP